MPYNACLDQPLWAFSNCVSCCHQVHLLHLYLFTPEVADLNTIMVLADALHWWFVYATTYTSYMSPSLSTTSFQFEWLSGHLHLTYPCSILQHGTNSRHYLWGGGVSFIMPAWPPLATGNGTFWTWRPAVLWLSSWLWIFRPTDWPKSSWTDRSPGCHPLPLTLVLWLLQGPRQILWWVIKPNCLYGWQASRSWMANIIVSPLHPVLLSSPTLSSWEFNVVLFGPGMNA